MIGIIIFIVMVIICYFIIKYYTKEKIEDPVYPEEPEDSIKVKDITIHPKNVKLVIKKLI